MTLPPEVMAEIARIRKMHAAEEDARAPEDERLQAILRENTPNLHGLRMELGAMRNQRRRAACGPKVRR